MFWLGYLLLLSALLRGGEARAIRQQIYNALPTSVVSFLKSSEKTLTAPFTTDNSTTTDPSLPVYTSFEEALKDIESPSEGLAYLYRSAMKPVEAKYQYQKFYNRTFLTEAEINAKPMVLVLGQYSTGKTTFIQDLLGKTYPGSHIGPQPTVTSLIRL